MTPLAPLRTLAALLLLVPAAAGCSGTVQTGPPSPGPAAASTAPAPVADVAPTVTPLIGAVVTPPVPVTATDGSVHLAYELSVTNTTAGPVELTAVRALSGDVPVADLTGTALTTRTRALGAPGTPTARLAAGQTGLIWLDVVVAPTAVPATLRHVVDLQVSRPVPPLVDAVVSQSLAPVAVDDQPAARIAPPLTGARWLDGDGCCAMSAHRRAANPLDGRLWFAERFAVDWVRLDAADRVFTGPADALSSYPYFGTDVLAVADGPVVAVLDGLPEQTPGTGPTGLPLDQYAGNHVVQDIGDGNFALYAHLQTGSVGVAVGDRLTTGRALGRLGNTGNSSAPHLHFQVMDSPDPLRAEGRPFTFGTVTLVGALADPADIDTVGETGQATLRPGDAPRTLSSVMPLDGDVVDFPAGAAPGPTP